MCKSLTITNPLTPCSLELLPLLCHPPGIQKEIYIFDTGRKITRHQWTILPLDNAVIQQVEFLAKKEAQPLLKNNVLLFERRPGVPLSDDDLQDEVGDHLAFGNEGDDDDFDPQEKQTRDVPLLHDEDITLGELRDLGPVEPPLLPRTPSLPPTQETQGGGDSISSSDDSNYDEESSADDDTTVTGEVPESEASDFEDMDEDNTGPESERIDSDPIRASPNIIDPVNEPTSERYSFRSRANLQERTTFNDDFNNPSNSSKSYSQQTHVQLFQHSVDNMIKRPKKLRDHVSSLYRYATHFLFNQMTANK